MNILKIFKDSVVSYLGRGLGINRIRNLNFAVTYRCNSRCLSCDIWQNYLKDKSWLKKELSTWEIRDIFLQFKYLKSVGITGGEPFLRDDLVEIVKVIKAPSVVISTNGLMPERVVRFVDKMVKVNYIKELGISVSIDAVGKLNDKARGINGSYEKSLETIRLLKRLQNKKIKIGISNTISKVNIDDVFKVHKLAKELDVIFSTRLAQSSGLFYKNIPSKIFIDEKDTPRVREIFQFLLKEYPRNIFYRYYLTKFLKNPNKQPVPCFSGFNNFFIDPYGNLYPCIMLNKKIGDLREKGLKSLLDSHEAEVIKRYIRDGECSCWTDCEAINAIYSNPIELVKAFFI